MKDDFWLTQATKLIWATIGQTSPNPAVAAIITKDGRFVSQGLHHGAGSDHAEVVAIKNAKIDLEGATIYVTLEPCNHFGNTPPCTDAIIKSGITKVVYGCQDTNPKVKGRGTEKLELHNISAINRNSSECLAIYAAFFKSMQQNKASITAKVAVDQLMHMASNDGSALKITSDALNLRVAHWRAFHDAIITTDQTIINDNPRLNARLKTHTESKPIFIIAQNDVFNAEQNVFKCSNQINIFLPYGTVLKDQQVSKQAEILFYDGDFASWDYILQTAANLGYHRLWLEAGPKTSKYVIQNNIADDVLILQSSTEFEASHYNLQDLVLPAVPVKNIFCNQEEEAIFHFGNTQFPSIFIDKERLCLPE